MSDKTIELGEITPVDIGELDSSYKEVLFSDRPWLVVVHEALDTKAQCFAMNERIAKELEIGNKVWDYNVPFTNGTHWHSDGKKPEALANIFSSYGPSRGAVFLARILADLDIRPRPVGSEEEILTEAIKLGDKLIKPLMRVPYGSTVTAVWREVMPLDISGEEFYDVGHAVHAEPGRTSAVSEYDLV